MTLSNLVVKHSPTTNAPSQLAVLEALTTDQTVAHKLLSLVRCSTIHPTPCLDPFNRQRSALFGSRALGREAWGMPAESGAARRACVRRG